MDPRAEHSGVVSRQTGNPLLFPNYTGGIVPSISGALFPGRGCSTPTLHAGLAHNPARLEQEIATDAETRLSVCCLCGLGVQVFL